MPVSSPPGSGIERSLNRAGLSPVCSCKVRDFKVAIGNALSGVANDGEGGVLATIVRACSSQFVALMVVNSEAATILGGAGGLEPGAVITEKVIFARAEASAVQ